MTPLTPVYAIVVGVFLAAFYAYRTEAVRKWIFDTIREAGESASQSARAEIVKWAGISAVGIVGTLTAGEVALNVASQMFRPVPESAAPTVADVRDAELPTSLNVTESEWSEVEEFTLPGASVTVLFQCDWDGAPRDDAIDCDGDGFEGYPDDWSVEVEAGSTLGLTVVDASDEGLGPDWPNDRAMRIGCYEREPTGCGRQVVRNTQEWANMGAGDVLAYRATLTESSHRLVATNTPGSNDHGWGPTEAGGSTASVYIGRVTESPADSFRIGFAPQHHNGGFPDDSWVPSHDPAVADANTNTDPGEGLVWFPGDFPVEWHLRLEFVSDLSFHASLRIYDGTVAGEAGLLYDDSDFVNKQNQTLDNFEGPFTHSASAPWNWDFHSLGLSAFAENESEFLREEGSPVRYYGGVAVCKGDWCPRYGGLPGEGN